MFDIFPNMKAVDIRIVKQLYKINMLKAWDYAQTTFRSEKLQIAYPKADIGTRQYRTSTKIGTGKVQTID